MNNLNESKKLFYKSIRNWQERNPLAAYRWLIDYSNATGQRDAKIAPLLFTSRSAARKENQSFPKGKIIRIKPIKEAK